MTEKLKNEWEDLLHEAAEAEEWGPDLPSYETALRRFSGVAPEDPEGFLEIVRGCNQEDLETIAPFFTDIAYVHGREWYDKIREALPDHATEMVYRNLNYILKM